MILDYLRAGTSVTYQQRFKDKVYGFYVEKNPTKAIVYKNLAIRDSYNDTMEHILWLLLENGHIWQSNDILKIEQIDREKFEIDTGEVITTISL